MLYTHVQNILMTRAHILQQFHHSDNSIEFYCFSSRSISYYYYNVLNNIMCIRSLGVCRSRLICVCLAAELYVIQLKITFSPAPHAHIPRNANYYQTRDRFMAKNTTRQKFLTKIYYYQQSQPFMYNSMMRLVII